jgi:hypothetical protein
MFNQSQQKQISSYVENVENTPKNLQRVNFTNKARFSLGFKALYLANSQNSATSLNDL